MKKIGLYFGSFNPIHFGHLHIAGLAQKQMALDEVWMVVSPQNPFKQDKSLAPDEHRLQMTLLACAHVDHVRVSDIEFHLERPSYTIHTLKELSSKHPDTAFLVIVGEDSLDSFHKWKEPESILELCQLIVYPRFHSKPMIPSELQKYSGRIHFISGGLIPISATEIREKIARRENIGELVPENVIEYINSHNLYN